MCVCMFPNLACHLKHVLLLREFQRNNWRKKNMKKEREREKPNKYWIEQDSRNQLNLNQKKRRRIKTKLHERETKKNSFYNKNLYQKWRTGIKCKDNGEKKKKFIKQRLDAAQQQQQQRTNKRTNEWCVCVMYFFPRTNEMKWKTKQKNAIKLKIEWWIHTTHTRINETTEFEMMFIIMIQKQKKKRTIFYVWLFHFSRKKEQKYWLHILTQKK